MQRLPWLPLYLLLLFALTLFPFRAAPCPDPGWIAARDPYDFATNILLFLPLGVALVRTGPGRTLAWALALSLTIELSQGLLPRRQDVTDLVANGGGAVLGFALARAWLGRFDPPALRPVSWRLLLRTGSVLLLLFVLHGALSRPARDLGRWQSAPLVLGNVASGERPWLGSIAELTVYDRAIPLAGGVLPDDPSALPWSRGGPVLWQRFAAPRAGRLDGPDGAVEQLPALRDPPPEAAVRFDAEGLRLAPSGLQLAPALSRHLAERVGATGRLTLDLRLTPATRAHTGPAAILAFGQGLGRHDLLITQERRDLAVRLQTPGGGFDYQHPEITTSDRVLGLGEHHVRVVYDGFDVLLYVDGECRADGAVTVALAPLAVGHLAGASTVALVAAFALSAASFGAGTGRPFLYLGGGGVAWLLLQATSAFASVRDFGAPSLALALLALAAAWPLLRALSAGDDPG